MASYSSSNQCITVQNVNVNSVGDTPVFVPFGKFQVEIVKVTNASVDLSASSMTMALYTGPGATGSAIVAAALPAGLSTAAKVASMTVAVSDAVSGTVVNNTLRQIYIRNVVAHGSAATVTVIIKILRIP